MNTSDNLELLEKIESLARNAGEAILKIYHQEQDLEIVEKADNSPLTQADLASHNCIVEGLKSLTPEIPILSEEGADLDLSKREQWKIFWLVDPLDGTKEFINRNGEFTVNIALIEQGEPRLGVVYVPVTQLCYAGVKGEIVYKRTTMDAEKQEIKTRPLPNSDSEGQTITVVSSRRHGTEALASCLEKIRKNLGDIKTTNLGSSLKICLVAEGGADIYPRLAPTSQWDTAAAQAVLEAAGGMVVDTDLSPLRYFQKESLLNPHFYALGDLSVNWKETFEIN